MPSPFPGMDPYLEGSLWTTLHFSLGAEIVRTLAMSLPPRYLVLPVERMVMETPNSIVVSAGSIYPDVGVVDTHNQADVTVTTGTQTVAPIQMMTVMPEQVPDLAVEIRTAKNRDLVTAIEILSPSNKRRPGYTDYVHKRDNILLSPAHLLEIDLLRKGLRVPMQRALPPADYFIFLSHARQRPATDIWSISLKHRLPTVPVPLLPGDPDQFLDLQTIFSMTYDLLRYRQAIDYTESPEIPLSDETQMWAETLLQQNS